MSIFKGKLAGWLFKGSGTAPADGDLWAYDSTEKLWEIRAAPSLPIITRKTADESVTGSQTLQDDNHLSFSIGASETWVVDILLRVSTPANGGFRCTFTLPASASMFLQTESIVEGGDETSAVGTTPGTALVLAASGALTYVRIKGLLRNSINAGTATLQWAQGLGGGTTTVYTDSYMIRTKG